MFSDSLFSFLSCLCVLSIQLTVDHSIRLMMSSVRSENLPVFKPSVLVDVLGESRALGSLISHIVKSSSFTPPINKEELESITRSRGIQIRISCRAGVRKLFICLGDGDHPFCLIGARNFLFAILRFSAMLSVLGPGWD